MRKRGKKEIIVKTVFTCIFIFMAWWLFIVWERFADDMAVGKSVDDVSMLMLWYDIQNKRYLPEDACIKSFTMRTDEDKEIILFSFTVNGEKNGEQLDYTYTETKGEKRTFEQEAREERIDEVEAKIFFRAVQVLQIEQKITPETKVTYVRDSKASTEQEEIWLIEDEELIVGEKEIPNAKQYVQVKLEHPDGVQTVYIRK